jgi:hypothetical protein
MGGLLAEIAVERTSTVTAGADGAALVAVIHAPSRTDPERTLAAALEAAAEHGAVIVSTAVRRPGRADAGRFATTLIDGARRTQSRSDGVDRRPGRRLDEATSSNGRPC